MKGRCFLLVVVLLLCLVLGVSALDDYNYYQDISYSACNQTIYQQDIVVNRRTGTAHENTTGGLNIWTTYVDSHCEGLRK